MIDPKQRRELSALANRLKASLTIGGDDVSDSVIAHVRDAMKRTELMKIRVDAEERAVCDAVAEQLETRVPCDVVQRVGRVLTLYRPLPAG